MVSGFKTRKISGNDKTLGEIFKSTREKKEISLDDAEIGSKVRIKYLKALEAGDWQALPSFVYTRGFVLAYAAFLGIAKKEIEPIFFKEYGFMSRERKNDLSYKRLFTEKRVLITPKLLAYSTLGVFLLAMFVYIGYQIINFAGSPNLRLTTPTNNTIVESEAINIAGLTDNDNYLTVNNEPIPVNTDGHFSTNLKLQKGLNVVQVKVTNRANKQTSEVVTIEYKPKTAMTSEAAGRR